MNVSHLCLNEFHFPSKVFHNIHARGFDLQILNILDKITNTDLNNHLWKHLCWFTRDHESTRISLRALKSLRNKSRKDKNYLSMHVFYAYTLWSSAVYCCANVRKKSRSRFLLNCCGRICQSIRNMNYRARWYLTTFSCYKLMWPFKSETLIGNDYKNIFSRDQFLFTWTKKSSSLSPRWWVGICALWFCNNTQGISSTSDLIQITNIGNQLYSNLSYFTSWVFSMQTELPTTFKVFKTDYQLE